MVVLERDQGRDKHGKKSRKQKGRENRKKKIVDHCAEQFSVTKLKEQLQRFHLITGKSSTVVLENTL